MTISTHFQDTESEPRRQGIEAQMAYEEATELLARLVLKLKEIGRRARSLHAIMNAIELNPAEPLQSESRVPIVRPNDYEGSQLATVRELTIQIVLARREVAE